MKPGYSKIGGVSVWDTDTPRILPDMYPSIHFFKIYLSDMFEVLCGYYYDTFEYVS